MMIEPQKLDYVSSDFDPPAILAKFLDQEYPIQFPVSKVIINYMHNIITVNHLCFRLLIQHLLL